MTSHTADWAYKATKAKVSLADTERVAALGFLCRSSVTSTGAWPANVRHVEVGDVIHFFYALAGKKPRSLGRYEVITPAAHPRPALFDAAVPSCALFTAKAGGELETLLASLPGYARDAKLGAYSGWVLRKTGEASMDALRSFAPGARSTLVALP